MGETGGKGVSWQQKLFDVVWAGVVAGESQWNPEKSCYDLAREFRGSGRGIAACVDGFIDWQAAKAGAGGFMLGLPGIVTSAVSIPADLTMTTYIQLRMVAVIALLNGWDIRAGGLKTVAFLSLLGSDAAGFLRKLGLPAEEGPVPTLFAGLPAPLLEKINGIIAGKLVVGAAKTGVIGMVKFVPVVGGLVNGALDGLATRSIGREAAVLFRGAPAAGAAPQGTPPQGGTMPRIAEAD
jgi:uncharacterized protein (DUF697 family)